MRRARKGVGTQSLYLLAVALSFTMPAVARTDWDRTANVKEAAKRLAVLHRTEGSQGVVKFLDACYKTHTIASEFTAGLEACMAQDYMHSRVLAEIYAKLPAEARSKMNAPTPEFIANTMNARFASIQAQYKLSEAETNNLRKSFDKDGLPLFIKSAFPQPKKNEGTGEGSRAGAGDKKN